MKRIFALSGILVMLGLALSCSKEGPTSPKIPTQTGVSITSDNSTIVVGGTEQMRAVATMSDGTTKTGNGTWGSDTPSVATVDQSGLVRGVMAGQATIYFDANGGGRGTKLMTVRNAWKTSGKGDSVFDMPTYVSRVKITGKYTGYSSNFIVWVGGHLLVNELLGTGWDSTRYEGTLLTTGGVVQIEHSSGVSWSFTEVPATTALASTFQGISTILDRSDPRYNQYQIYLEQTHLR